MRTQAAADLRLLLSIGEDAGGLEAPHELSWTWLTME
jgi:hypothetical protein